jgi:outer membrane lipoprotein carrier protein
VKYFLIWIWVATVFVRGEGNIVLPRSWSASFVQKVTNPRKKILRYSGDFYGGADARFKWNYLKPTKKEVCSDGKRITVVDHDLEQISYYRMEKGFNLEAILKKAKHYKDNLYTAEYRGHTYTFAVDDRGFVEQIAYRDDMDNVVHIRFEKIRVYKNPVAASKMQCSHPDGYDVIGIGG